MSNNIKEAFKKTGLTNKAISQALGVSPETMRGYRWEGRPMNSDKLQKLADLSGEPIIFTPTEYEDHGT